MPVKKARKHSKTEAKYVVPAHVVKIVKKVQHHILEEPKRFDMGEWIRSARSIRDRKSTRLNSSHLVS